MGLPMYRDPDEVTVEAKIAKVERTAAIRRSTIRRESTVRPHRQTPTNVAARRELAELTTDGDQPHRSPFVDANDEIQHLEAELARWRRHRILTPRRDSNRRVATVTPQDVVLQGSNVSIATNQLPRESALRFELGSQGHARAGTTSPRRHRVSRNSLVNPRTLPSPPYSSDSLGRVSLPREDDVLVEYDGPEDADTAFRHFSPEFAPARGPYNDTPQPSDGRDLIPREHRPEQVAVPRPAENTAADTPPPDMWEASYPPLRRVGHLSPRPRSSSPGSRERRRSISASSPVSADSVVNEDHWETLLTTINDEPLHHQSSFDSTRSNSERDSNQSTQTAATSFGEIGSADDTCDLDLPQGITEEDVREIRERHRGSRGRTQPDTNAALRRDDHNDSRPGSAGEMAMFQHLLTRFSRRNDISDEWWAAAGLARARSTRSITGTVWED